MRASTRDAVALQISHMPGDRRRPELRASVAHDPHLDDDTAHVGPSCAAGPCGIAATETRSSAAFPARAEAASGVSGLLCRARHLADERLGLPALRAAVARPSWANCEIIVAGAHRTPIPGRMVGAIRARNDFTSFFERAAGRLILGAEHGKAAGRERVC